MAAPKRAHGRVNVTESVAKRLRSDGEDERLSSFLKWCSSENLKLSKKVRIAWEGSCAQYGMVAIDDILESECLFEIPRTMLLTPDTCQIAQLLKDEAASLQSSSGWLPLLVSLMYEYTNPTSRWRSYYTLVPDFDELDLPMCWPSEELSRELKGTGVVEAVCRDVSGLEKEFHEVVLPFIQQHQDTFHDKRCRDVEFFKKMVAFVMAYSFTENPQVEDGSDDEGDESEKKALMMVPMADILNHVAKNNARLDFGKDSLKMVATKSIDKGEEVFNTYGELPNWQLLQVYGFAEVFPHNHFDSVDISMEKSFKWISEGKKDAELTFMMQKWDFLKGLDVIQNDGAFVIGVDGVLTEDEMLITLKVMAMDAEQFAEYKEKEGWSDVEDDNDVEEALTLTDIRNKPKALRELLNRLAEGQLGEYTETREEIEKQLQDVNYSKLSRRQQLAVIVKDGQMKLLNALIQACQ